MADRTHIPPVVEIGEFTEMNPLILGLASMLAQRLIARAKAKAAHPPAPES